jgi:uridine kinase
VAPLIIGIAGGSGSGKTTVAERVRSTLSASTSVGPGGTANVVTLEHDSYYRDRPELTYDERCQLNFDHPDSLETELLVAHIRALRQGEPVSVPSYDFKTHRRADERRRVEPSRVIIVEGILVFADETLRKELDVRIYVDTDADIRAFRRIRRDLTQRGRSFESIREQYYRTVRPMHLQFVEPSKRYAHVILPEGGENTIGIDLVVGLIEKQASAPSKTAR